MQSKLKNSLSVILIDGPMGSGKTTVANLLHKKLKRTASLGLDRIKWFISDFKRISSDNDIVRNVVIAMTKEYLRQGISVIIEQGMGKKWVEGFRRIAKKYKAHLFVYQLHAPKPLLLKRIKERPKIAGRPPVSRARIERNYMIYHANRYSGAVVLDAEKLAAEKLTKHILSDLKSKIVTR